MAYVTLGLIDQSCVTWPPLPAKEAGMLGNRIVMICVDQLRSIAGVKIKFCQQGGREMILVGK